MKEQTFERPIVITLPEPHFDDERTLLSARPVVPLNKIDAKLQHRRRWLLGGAFAVAMMLGAASALVASYLKLRSASNAATQISNVETAAPQPEVLPQPEGQPEQQPVEEPETVASSQLPVTENVEAPAETEAPKKVASAVKRRPVVQPVEDPIEDIDTRRISEEDQLRRIREAVLVDEWQERRLRRAARRERRLRDDHHDRDLSNLDEIFEGRRRRP